MWHDLLDWSDRTVRDHSPLLGAGLIAVCLALVLAYVGPVPNEEHDQFVTVPPSVTTVAPTVERPPAPVGAATFCEVGS